MVMMGESTKMLLVDFADMADGNISVLNMTFYDGKIVTKMIKSDKIDKIKIDNIENFVEGERINYNRRELTEQEMELVQMHNQV